MQTQCPHCNTRFRVTDAQLEVADGFVRCGVCDEIFKADESAHVDSATPPEQIDFNTRTADDPGRKDAFDFFDETVTQSLPHVVPAKLRDEPVSQPSPVIGTLLWGTGSLLLIITLMLEHVWFNRTQFIDVPELEPVFEQLCGLVDCLQISIRQPSAIELVSRNVYSHPEHKKALKVDLSIRNDARFSQPYPVMQVEFADVRGFVVAARRFHPHEYLFGASGAPPATPLLQAGSQTELSFDIVDPGKHAVAYEFSFL